MTLPAVPTNEADMAELQAGLRERAFYCMVSPSTLLNQSGFDVVLTMPSANTYRTTFIDPEVFSGYNLGFAETSGRNRPLDFGDLSRQSDYQNTEWLLQFTELGGVTLNNPPSLFWLDGTKTIDGQADMPWLCGIPGLETVPYNHSYYASPYNWPQNLIMGTQATASNALVPGAWLALKGLTSRPSPLQYVPDNAEFLAYAKAYAQTLNECSFVVPLLNGTPYLGPSVYPAFYSETLYTYRTGGGYDDHSYSSALSQAQSVLATQSYSQQRSRFIPPDNCESINTPGTWRVYNMQIGAFGACFWNSSDISLQVDLYSKSGLQYYNYNSIPSSGPVDFQWANNSVPVWLTPDGLWHKVSGGSATVAPGQVYFYHWNGNTEFDPPEASAGRVLIYGPTCGFGFYPYLYAVCKPTFSHLL
jgi:hypothetical protein